MPTIGFAAPADEALVAVEQWAAAFNAGDVDRVVAAYTPGASVHGTVAAQMAIGADALRAYFSAAARARTQVTLGENSVSATLSPDQVVLAGFYEFSGTRADGQSFAAPARYSFVLTHTPEGWRIVHHHSSPRARP